jgi:hypothetical protein
MTGIYYVEAADWLRSVGLTVVEVKGWQTRARSSGGFAAPPLGVAWHHTASQTTIQNDTNWEYFYSDVRPIGNMTLARNGDIWIGAAGAANTQGKGGPVTLSRGTIPIDGGNTRAWAIEVCNNGVGEPWPRVQIDAYFAASNELNRRFGNKPTDIFTHAFWTPGRKIDPAKASAVLGPWQPRPTNSSGTWNNDDIRAECSKRATATTPPPTKPPTTGDTVNWNPTTATVTGVKDAPPVNTTIANQNNDWAMIAFLKAIQKMAGLPITGKYDQPTANVVDSKL